MNLGRIIREVLTPGKPEFHAHLSRLKEREAVLLRSLEMIDNPTSQSVIKAADEAAEMDPPEVKPQRNGGGS